MPRYARFSTGFWISAPIAVAVVSLPVYVLFVWPVLRGLWGLL